MSQERQPLAHERRGSGPPVVFVHGWLTGGRIWQRLLDAMAGGDELGFDAIVPDLRGSGRSGGVASTELADHAEDVWATVDELGLRGPVDVVGHSMGGAVAALMATKQPTRVRRLVLTSSVPPGGFPLPDDVYARFDAVGGDTAALRSFLEPQVPPNDLDWLVELCAETSAESARNALRAWTGASFAESAKQLTHAPLVIAGAHDPFLGPDLLREKIVDLIDGARLVTVDGGHYPLLDAADELADHVDRELSRAG